MSPAHKVYLIVGSNIDPEINLQRAIDLLLTYGSLGGVSTIWESKAVGSGEANFLNAAMLFFTATSGADLKSKIIRPIEKSLGRVRSEDKNAARTIDIDILMVDEEVYNVDRWNNAYVVVPMAELLPNLLHPLRHEKLVDVARKLRAETWIAQHPEILLSFCKEID